jgi:hypothetical protein
MAVVRTSSNVGLEGAEGVTVATCTDSLTKVMRIQQAIFSVTQRFAGVLPSSR